MAGASRRHNRIVANMVTALDDQLRDLRCNVYSNGLRAKIPATVLCTCPDLVVTCGGASADEEQDVLLNLFVIFEVLLVAQNARRVERYVRREDGRTWLCAGAHEADSVFGIRVIGRVLKSEEVYAKD